MKSLHHLTDLQHRFGIRAAVLWTLDRICGKLLRTELARLFWLDLERRIPSPHFQSDVTFRFLSADDVRRYSVNDRLDLEPAMVERIEACADLCMAAFVNGTLTSYGWLAFESIEPEHHGGVAMSFPSHVAYLYKTFTLPDHRGQHLVAGLIDFAIPTLADRGIHSLVSNVPWTNWPSVHAFRRLGFAQIGLLMTFSLGKSLYYLAPRRAGRLGLEFSSKAIPRTTLNRFAMTRHRNAESAHR